MEPRAPRACSISGLSLAVSQLGLRSPLLYSGTADTSSAAALGSAAQLMTNLQTSPMEGVLGNQATMQNK